MEKNDCEIRIREGDWVVLHACDGRRVLGNASKASSARICKRKRKLSRLIGEKWGQNFMILNDDTLKPIADEVPKTISDESSMVSEKNNQYLQDSTKNQKLEQQVINNLKKSGVQGEELVQTVVQNSSTFKDKTSFSQDKYLKKKRDKFDLNVRVVRPTITSLCDVYSQKSPDKTMNLRCDSLAMLLNYAGVHSGKRCLVYENCIGLVTGAVVERLGGKGIAINLFTGGSTPGIELLRMLNFSSDQMRTIVHTPLQLLDMVDTVEDIDSQPIKYSPTNNNPSNDDDKNNIKNSASDSTINNNHDSNENGFTKGNMEISGHHPSASRAEAIAQRPKRGQLKQWLKSGCDSLIVATRFDVVKVFDTILKYLAPSGCFAAYCTHLQDASDLQYALQLSRMATRVELWESNLVHHQVLPGRTHPEMTDSATGGYVVTGIRIEIEQLD